ncbi:unnamed protein product [Angiostrongylus costaricensis]|uniref:SET domain-containing protein n=1 Tax=Angiostrongylus costaricensis TaxID=334426 RepID=A0A0R3PJM4_ANGCS|nr:unnamed protein product [Angiostrongylus costaricensis]
MESDFFPPFSRNETFPQLCDGVNVGYEPRRGKYVRATRDIPCGEVVCLDVGKVISLDPGLCSYCLSKLPPNRIRPAFVSFKALTIFSIATLSNRVGLFPTASWFNHSCRANVKSFFHGNKLIFISMGIRKGEEVCDNYGVSFFKHTKKERKDFLAGRGFTCACSVCVANDSIDDMLEPIMERPDVCVLNLKLF